MTDIVSVETDSVLHAAAQMNQLGTTISTPPPPPDPLSPSGLPESGELAHNVAATQGSIADYQKGFGGSLRLDAAAMNQSVHLFTGHDTDTAAQIKAHMQAIFDDLSNPGGKAKVGKPAK